jgi:hypothetical protein
VWAASRGPRAGPAGSTRAAFFVAFADWMIDTGVVEGQQGPDGDRVWSVYREVPPQCPPPPGPGLLAWLDLLARWVPVVILGGLAGAFLMPRMFGVPSARLVALDERGVPTTGAVAALHLDNHNDVTYAYQVGGTTYRGDWSPLHIDTEKLSPGDRVPVFYDPRTPATSCLCTSPHEERLWEEDSQTEAGALAGGGAAPFLTFLGIRWLSVVTGRDLPLGLRRRRKPLRTPPVP